MAVVLAVLTHRRFPGSRPLKSTYFHTPFPILFSGSQIIIQIPTTCRGKLFIKHSPHRTTFQVELAGNDTHLLFDIMIHIYCIVSPIRIILC